MHPSLHHAPRRPVLPISFAEVADCSFCGVTTMWLRDGRCPDCDDALNPDVEFADDMAADAAMEREYDERTKGATR